MDAYEYSSLDQSGKTKTGIIQADTARHVRQLLRDQKLIPVKIEKIDANIDTDVGKKHNTHLRAGELPIIIRQLSTLLKAGLPLDEALSTITEQSEHKNSKKILITLRAKLMEGHPLAYAMELFPKAFDELITTSVEAGEQSGNLDEVLLRLAEYLEKKRRHEQTVMDGTIVSSDTDHHLNRGGIGFDGLYCTESYTGVRKQQRRIAINYPCTG